MLNTTQQAEDGEMVGDEDGMLASLAAMTCVELGDGPPTA